MARRVFLLLFAVLATLVPVAAHCAPDQYLGDAAIYTATDTSTEKPRPNVLIIIDNSQSTLNRASGVAYDPNTTYPSAGYNPWDIYLGDNQGGFSHLEVSNSDNTLSNLQCDPNNTHIVRDSLLNNGTYSGSGFSADPNLDGGACATGPKGQVYALGNYLNYIHQSVTANGNLVTHQYTVEVSNGNGSNNGGGNGNNYTEEQVTGVFQCTQNHTSSSTTEPEVGADWQSYWTLLGNDPTQYPTATAWTTDNVYNAPAVSGDTQRKIIYDALKTVVGGARYAVNFAALSYGHDSGGTKGGKLLYPMSDLRSDTAFNAFLASLPGPGDNDGEPVVPSQTARPQAEALYDAGHYFGATYPYIAESSTISDTMKNPCGYNHIILITDGLSNNDDNPKLATYIGDYDHDGWNGGDESVYGNGSHYLDDVATYLNVNMGITTHTVLAFQAADPLVEHAAAEGGGVFYNVYNANALADALTKLLANIVAEVDTSFVAPVVPASSTNRTISSNRVYLGLFKPQTQKAWLGNLKKYGVDSNLDLVDKNGDAATYASGTVLNGKDVSGNFIPNSKSYWGTNDSGAIVSSAGPLPLSGSSISGDGGNVTAGGVGGTLQVRLQKSLSDSAYDRKIYTHPPGSTSDNLTNGANQFSTGNATLTAADLGFSGASADTDKDKLIKYIQGYDAYDDNGNGNTTEVRPWVMGDILHSKPVIFNYTTYSSSGESDCNQNTTRIFVGANDGMLHDFRDCDGSEEWAFVPDNLLPQLKYLRQPEHTYFTDGTPTLYVHDKNNDGSIESPDDKVILIFGQRRGGGRNTLDATGSRGAYYALNISDPSDPIYQWKVDSTTTDTAGNFSEMGEPWSQPRLAKVKIGTAIKVVAFFGAGYDNNEDLRYGSNQKFPDDTTASTDTSATTFDSGNAAVSSGTSDQVNPRGRGIYAVEVATMKTGTDGKYYPDFTNAGKYVWGYTPADNSHLKYSFPTNLTVLDTNNDGFVDRIYAGDTGGNMWRFDVGSTSTDQWSGKIIFSANPGDTNGTADGSNGRKIFYKPVVAMIGGIPYLYFGTGDRAHPLNANVVDRLYCIKDKGQETDAGINESDLKDVTDDLLQAYDQSQDTIDGILNALNGGSNYGWYIRLSDNAGEKVLAPATVFNKQVFFTTYTPLADPSSNPCEVGNLGTSRVYQVDYKTGEAVVDNNLVNDTDAQAANDTNTRASGGEGIILRKSDRVKTMGEGIPSGIVTLIDSSGKVNLLISSSNKVGTYSAPNSKMVSPLYWMEW